MINLLTNIASNSGLFHNIIVWLGAAGILLIFFVGFVPAKQWRKLKRWLKRHHIKWAIARKLPDNATVPLPFPRPPKTIPIPKPPVHEE